MQKYCKENPHVYPKSLIASNSKTGYSFNREVSSCTSATPECKDYCYRNRGHFLYPNVAKKLWQVENFIRDHNPRQIADGISKDIPYGVDFRWFGVGDLCKKLVEVINILAEERSDLQHYLYTKNLGFALQIDKRCAINFSLDKSTLPRVKYAALFDRRCSHFIVSYVAVDRDDFQDYMYNVDVIHPKTGGKEEERIVSNYVDMGYKKQLCEFSINKKATCSECRRCVLPKSFKSFPMKNLEAKESRKSFKV